MARDPQSNKKIMKAYVLERAAQHHADEKGFEQYYSYECMVIYST